MERTSKNGIGEVRPVGQEQAALELRLWGRRGRRERHARCEEGEEVTSKMSDENGGGTGVGRDGMKEVESPKKVRTAPQGSTVQAW